MNNISWKGSIFPIINNIQGTDEYRISDFHIQLVHFQFASLIRNIGNGTLMNENSEIIGHWTIKWKMTALGNPSSLVLSLSLSYVRFLPHLLEVLFGSMFYMLYYKYFPRPYFQKKTCPYFNICLLGSWCLNGSAVIQLPNKVYRHVEHLKSK